MNETVEYMLRTFCADTDELQCRTTSGKCPCAALLSKSVCLCALNDSFCPKCPECGACMMLKTGAEENECVVCGCVTINTINKKGE